MKYKDLLNVEAGVILNVSGKPFPVDEVSNYASRTAKWFNLVSKPGGGEKVLELSDGDVRLWEQVANVLNTSPDLDELDYNGHHFEVDESRVRAKTETRNAQNELQTELSVTSVYVTEDDEDILLSIELKGDKIFVWYSNGTIFPKDIKMS